MIGGLGSSLWATLAGGIVLGVAQTIGGQINPEYPVLAGHLVFLLVLASPRGGLLNLRTGGAHERRSRRPAPAQRRRARSRAGRGSRPASPAASAGSSWRWRSSRALGARHRAGHDDAADPRAHGGDVERARRLRRPRLGRPAGLHRARRLRDGLARRPRREPVSSRWCIATLFCGAVSIPLSFLLLRFRGAQFAIGTWVVAEALAIYVSFDSALGAGTGTSLIQIDAYAPGPREHYTYWLTLGLTAFFLGALFLLLRSRLGSSLQAIRDDEDAAASVGVRVVAGKRILFVLAATGAGAAGAMTLANTLFIEPTSIFSVNYTRLHDLHGAGRRPRHLRGPDHRSDRPLRHPEAVRQRRRLVSRRARRRGDRSSRCCCRAGCGGRSRSAPACASCRSAIASDPTTSIARPEEGQ